MSLMSPNILLLSIRHQYASAIFEGDKKVELRRVRPRNLNADDLILVYATSPERALVGLLEVEKVVEMSLDRLWLAVENKAGISHDDFMEYYKNLSIGYAIFLKNALSFEQPIELSRLKEEWTNFCPPQCYRYLREEEINLIQSMTKHDILGMLGKKQTCQTELLTYDYST